MRRNLRVLSALPLMSLLLQPALGEEPPAVAIVEKMAVVSDGLNRIDTGKPVQTKQKEVIQDLDAWIASLEKQCENCKNGMKKNRPNRGMDDSRIGSGTGGVGTLLNPSDMGKDWGKLSDRERDRILQSMTEGFPPEYRTVLERYYRRLADEKSGAGSKAKAPVADAKQADAKP